VLFSVFIDDLRNIDLPTVDYTDVQIKGKRLGKGGQKLVYQYTHTEKECIALVAREVRP
jgi:hypothetical protein